MNKKDSASVIRTASERDLEPIAQLYQKSFPEHILVQRRLLNDVHYLDQRIKNPDERWVIAEDEGSIVGVAALAIAAPVGLGEIERVCVSHEHRGNGIAEDLCGALVDHARNAALGFVEAFARGDQPAMQRTFEKLGFKVYGVSPRFEILHDKNIVREQFVHMGLELKPETIDEQTLSLIPSANKIYCFLRAYQK